MFKVIVTAIFLVFSNLSHAAGGYCYNSKTSERQAGPGCLETAWSIADERWKSEYPSSVSCATFNTSVAPMSGGTAYSRVRKNTTLGGCADGGYYGHETTCLDGYHPNESLTQCVADPGNEDDQEQRCKDLEGLDRISSSPEGWAPDRCVDGCFLAFQSGLSGSDPATGNTTYTTFAKYNGEMCNATNPDDPDVPEEEVPVIDAETKKVCQDSPAGPICSDESQRENNCFVLNGAEVCESDFPQSGFCRFTPQGYICKNDFEQEPDSQQTPKTPSGENLPPTVIIDNSSSTTNTNYTTTFWTSDAISGAGIDSGRSDSMNLDGIAKEGTLSALLSEVKRITDATGPELLQPGTEIESWPDELPSDSNEEQLEEAVSWGPLEDLVSGVTGINPSTTVPGLESGSCSSYTFGIGNRTIAFPGVEGCERLGWLKLGLAWVFAVFTLMKIYEIAFGVNKS